MIIYLFIYLFIYIFIYVYIYLFVEDNFVLWYYKDITTFKVSINYITGQNLSYFTHLFNLDFFYYCNIRFMHTFGLWAIVFTIVRKC